MAAFKLLITVIGMLFASVSCDSLGSQEDSDFGQYPMDGYECASDDCPETMDISDLNLLQKKMVLSLDGVDEVYSPRRALEVTQARGTADSTST